MSTLESLRNAASGKGGLATRTIKRITALLVSCALGGGALYIVEPKLALLGVVIGLLYVTNI